MEHPSYFDGESRLVILIFSPYVLTLRKSVTAILLLNNKEFKKSSSYRVHIITHKYQRPLSCQRRLASSRLIKRVILFPHQFLFFDFSSIPKQPEDAGFLAKYFL
jgi:hypothetical protein